jgi:LuxR family transcriptional regulator, maltose regulon positive regulatory protein
MDLIRSKTSVPNESPLVPRRRLLEMLQESLNCCNSTIITGRAGTGKTILAADFARYCGRRVAWYKVDAPDADLWIFLDYFMKSLVRTRPEFGGEALMRAIWASPRVNLSTLAEAFVDALQQQNDPLLIVIDDLHLIYDADWVVPFIHRMLPLLPVEVHLLILGRSLPPAPLWRLRSKQRLCVIDEPLLAFSTDEAIKLFANYGLSAQQAAVALVQTRGRAAALHTVALQNTDVAHVVA